MFGILSLDCVLSPTRQQAFTEYPELLESLLRETVRNFRVTFFSEFLSETDMLPFEVIEHGFELLLVGWSEDTL